MTRILNSAFGLVGHALHKSSLIQGERMYFVCIIIYVLVICGVNNAQFTNLNQQNARKSSF